MDNETPEKRPSCGYKPNAGVPCGSEDRLYNVTGTGRTWGKKMETPVCRPHLEEALKKWNYETAEPIGVMGKK